MIEDFICVKGKIDVNQQNKKQLAAPTISQDNPFLITAWNVATDAKKVKRDDDLMKKHFKHSRFVRALRDSAQLLAWTVQMLFLLWWIS